jgi:hypothetical protein
MKNIIKKYKDEIKFINDIEEDVEYLSRTELKLAHNKKEIFSLINKYAYMFLEDMKKDSI